MPEFMDFKGGPSSQESATEKRPNSPEVSCASLKSERSMPEFMDFKGGPSSQERGTEERRRSFIPCKTDFNEGRTSQKRQNSSSVRERKRTPSTDTTAGIHSKGRDHCEMDAAVKTPKLKKKMTDFLYNIFNDLENKMIVFIKHELEMFKKLLRKENTRYYGEVRDDLWSIKEAALDMALYFLKLMEHNDLADALQGKRSDNALIEVQQRALKSNLCKKYKRVWEGIAKQGESSILSNIYTDLYITAGGSGQIKEEHEVRQIEKQKTRGKNGDCQIEQEEQIECKDMFKTLHEEEKPVRTVVTQGVAGIGKSICVQKFVLDWAEGKDYQDIQFIFPLPFRELNLIKEEMHSLRDLIYSFFPEVKGMRFTKMYKVMLIFDGLDECRLPLSFHENKMWTDASMPASLDTIMTNLMKGNLLPSALIWITTRPAAAAKIPAEHVDRVTEVRGFNDVQKVEYFRKNITDENLANKITDHIKGSKSLFIMCHIPVFCWVTATVLQEILGGTDKEDIPQTLTEMYTCFLIFQTIQGDKKYNRNNAADIQWDKEGILSLGKLAFSHLEGNLIFDAEDLKACGIDLNNIKVYSGLCTQETGRFGQTFFSFVHLSIQEFIAALFTYLLLRNEKKNVVEKPEESKETELIDLLRITVGKALESKNGHLDLFLRFLLGLSLESNQKLIRGLLTHTGSSSDCQKDIIDYIKDKLNQNLSPERSINLFYCLNELKDDSLVKEIQSYMSSGRLSKAELSPAQWSALVFVLLTSDEDLEVFELQKFIRSDECFKRLLPVVQQAKTALLSDCKLTERSCSALHTVLSSESSKLTEVDLSSNHLEDSGVTQLCVGLKNPNCKLEKLGLTECNLMMESCKALAEVLSSHRFLTELDLSKNGLQNSGVQQLSEGLKNQSCILKILRLSDCRITEEGYAALAEALKSSHLIELDLRGNDPGASGVKLLTDLLQDPDCKLEKLRLSDCRITEEGYAALAEALKSSHLIELDLRGNDPGASGVKLLTDLLQDPHCKLTTLRLLKSPEAEEACGRLTKVLETNPLLQTHLNLRGKIKGDSEVKQLSALLKDPHCRAEKLTLRKSGVTEEGCSALTSSFLFNPAHIKELDLSENKVGNSGVQRVCALLKHQPCNLQILRLCNCSVAAEGCAALAAALEENPSQLRELDLSGNKAGDSGIKQISNLLQNSHCLLETLNLSDCSITEEGYTALAEALRLNPSSHLRELDLRGNDPGASGVKQLSALLEDSHCRPEILKLLKSPEAEEACGRLTKVLETNPLLQTHLNLRGKIKGDSEVKQLSALLKDPHCRAETLTLSDCRITEEGYAALAEALKSSHLIELDLRGNDPGASGVKLLTDLLQDPDCKLEKLRLLKSDEAVKACDFLTEVLDKNPLLQKELDLSGKISSVSEVKQLSALLEDSHCTPEKLALNKSNLTVESCSALASVLKLKSCSVRELDLSNNSLQDPGVTQLSAGLKHRHCKLEILRLSDCRITEEGYAALAEALKSSHLIELDLRGNDPGASGVKLLTDLLQDPDCKLTTLSLLKRPAAQEACTWLNSVLDENPLLLKELDLSMKEPGDSGVKKLSALLEDSHCKFQKIRLYKEGSVTEGGCARLISALGLNPSHLRELDLNRNKPGESGLRNLCDFLKNPECKLQKLNLQKSYFSSKSCTALASALCTNPSHIRELDLSGCELGDSGVEKLCDLLKKHECKLETLLLSYCRITKRGGAALTAALSSNSSHLKVLDLRGNKLKDSLTQLEELLKRSGGQLIYDHTTWEKVKALGFAITHYVPGIRNSGQQPTLESESLTLQHDQREGKMELVPQQGSSVDNVSSEPDQGRRGNTTKDCTEKSHTSSSQNLQNKGYTSVPTSKPQNKMVSGKNKNKKKIKLPHQYGLQTSW
ncbi:protein NLRC3-like [Neoarius graeffei]|uniref:protein NLRC3-like n=1 Tax=Neoarius graeffei TaxID=443677 RepID=UPI00298C8023|nr:protein NLRC3-like [Neoarius graeffei]